VWRACRAACVCVCVGACACRQRCDSSVAPRQQRVTVARHSLKHTQRRAVRLHARCTCPRAVAATPVHACGLAPSALAAPPTPTHRCDRRAATHALPPPAPRGHTPPPPPPHPQVPGVLPTAVPALAGLGAAGLGAAGLGAAGLGAGFGAAGLGAAGLGAAGLGAAGLGMDPLGMAAAGMAALGGAGALSASECWGRTGVVWWHGGGLGREEGVWHPKLCLVEYNDMHVMHVLMCFKGHGCTRAPSLACAQTAEASLDYSTVPGACTDWCELYCCCTAGVLYCQARSTPSRLPAMRVVCMWVGCPPLPMRRL
jgi:hypothetical protein